MGCGSLQQQPPQQLQQLLRALACTRQPSSCTHKAAVSHVCYQVTHCVFCTKHAWCLMLQLNCGLTNRYDRQTAWQHQGIWRAALSRVSESGGHGTVRLLTMHCTHPNRHLQAAAIQAKTDATLAQYLNLPDNAITLITQRAPDCFPVLAHCNL